MVRSVWWQGLTRSLAVLAVLPVAALLMAGGPALAEPVLRIRVVCEVEANPPRILGSGTAIDRDRPGLTLELLRLVGARTGIEFVYERVPWKRALYLIETNEADALVHASFLPERMGSMVFPMKAGRPDVGRALFVQNYMFYKRAGTQVAWDGNALTGAGAPVGAVSGYSILGDLARLGIPVEEAKTLDQNLDKLAGGRISAYAGLEGMTDSLLAAHPLRYGSLVKMVPPLVSKPYHLVFSHGFVAAHRDVAERVWDGIAAVNASEEFATLVKRYAE